MVRLTVCLLLALGTGVTQEPQPLRGYSAGASAAERSWETRFRAIPSTDNLRDTMKRLSARPHHVGTAYDKALNSFTAR